MGLIADYGRFLMDGRPLTYSVQTRFAIGLWNMTCIGAIGARKSMLLYHHFHPITYSQLLDLSTSNP
jgi:hypothetical protein